MAAGERRKYFIHLVALDVGRLLLLKLQATHPRSQRRFWKLALPAEVYKPIYNHDTGNKDPPELIEPNKVPGVACRG